MWEGRHHRANVKFLRNLVVPKRVFGGPQDPQLPLQHHPWRRLCLLPPSKVMVAPSEVIKPPSAVKVRPLKSENIMPLSRRPAPNKNLRSAPVTPALSCDIIAKQLNKDLISVTTWFQQLTALVLKRYDFNLKPDL